MPEGAILIDLLKSSVMNLGYEVCIQSCPSDIEMTPSFKTEFLDICWEILAQRRQ